MTDFELFFNTHSHHSKNLFGIYQADVLSTEVFSSYFSIGIHPKDAKSNKLFNESTILTFENNPHLLAIGEIGLDNRYENTGEIQEQVYISQLQLAEKWNKPVILHCVSAWDRCRFLHQKHAPNTTLIFHGLNKASIFDNVLDYEKSVISIGTSILTNVQLQEKVRNMKLSRLLVETDDSEIPIELVYQKLAEIKSLTLHAFSEQIRLNIKQIFGI